MGGGYQSVENILKSVPGIFFSTTTGKDDMPELIMRGQAPGKASQNILVLLDGVPLNTLDTAGVNLSLIPVEDIKKIEVIPNGGNVLYGEGATAGIINITTVQNEKSKYYGYVGADFGNYGRRNGRLDIGTNITKRLSINLSYNKKNLDGYRHHSEKNMDYFSGKTNYRFDDGSLNLSYLNSKIDSKFSGWVDKNDIKKANSKTEATEHLKIYQANYIKKINKKISLYLNGDYTKRTYKSQTSDRDTKSHFLKPEIKYSYMDDNSSYITFGGDYSKGTSDYISQSHGKHGKNNYTKRKSKGIFISNTTTINRFIFTQGFRKQKIDFNQSVRKIGTGKNIDKKFSSDAYELSGLYNYTDTSNIYLSYTHTFRAPTVSEAGSWKGDINIQKNDTFELGTKSFLTDNIYLSGSIYNMTTEDEIFYMTSDSGEFSGNYNFDNKIKRNGIEITLEQYFGKFTFNQNISYIKHQVKGGKYSGNKIPGVPEYLMNVGVIYEIFDNVTLSTRWFYYGGSYAQYDYENKYSKQGGHTEVNLNLNYKMTPELSVYVGIDNLFDKEYFNAKAPTKKGGDMKYYYGNRRVLYIGVNYRF